MNLSPSAIKRTLAMLGVDISTIAEQAGPLIVDELNERLKDAQLLQDERAGFTLYLNNQEYFIRKVAIKPNGQLRPLEPPQPLNNTIQTILNTVLHAK